MPANTGALAGAIAGLVGCSTFLLLHALWIVPIWPVAPVGYAIAAAGASFGFLHERFAPSRLRMGIRFVAAFVGVWLILVPSVVLADAGLRVGAAAAPMILAGFFLTVLAVGAGLGWLGARTRTAAGSGALVGLLIAIGPGHNIPFLAGTGAVPLELVILTWVFLAASLTLVVAGQFLERRDAARPSR